MKIITSEEILNTIRERGPMSTLELFALFAGSEADGMPQEKRAQYISKINEKCNRLRSQGYLEGIWRAIR